MTLNVKVSRYYVTQRCSNHLFRLVLQTTNVHIRYWLGGKHEFDQIILQLAVTSTRQGFDTKQSHRTHTLNHYYLWIIQRDVLHITICLLFTYTKMSHARCRSQRCWQTTWHRYEAVFWNAKTGTLVKVYRTVQMTPLGHSNIWKEQKSLKYACF